MFNPGLGDELLRRAGCDPTPHPAATGTTEEHVAGRPG